MKKQDKKTESATPATGTGTSAKVEVSAVSSAKVVTAIAAIVAADAQVANATIAAVRTIRSEANRMNYDAKQARLMVTLSYRLAQGFTSKDETEISTFDAKYRPNVSRLMGIAFPEKERESAVNAALAHDEKLGNQKHGRIGTNKLLEISRGNLSFADAKAGKAPTRTPSGNGPKVQDLSATALENALAGIRSTFGTAKDKQAAAFTPQALRAMAEKVFCDGPYKPSTDTTAKA